MNKYPIYIPSKGRADSRLTVKALEEMNVLFRVVIEEQEFKEYSNVINKDKLLILPFSNLGQGSIPARNWIMEHSINEGHKRHWQLDDNIECFYRWHENRQIKVADGTCFKVIEDFTDRYTNIAQSGLQYFMFAPRKQKSPPYIINTRIYSCTLNNNYFTDRYRGKYNEDTDISLRLLKDGWCTVLFNAFLCLKITTLTMSGGNTDQLYAQTDNRSEFVDSLIKQHPDCVTKVWRYKRWHHEVDYRRFKINKLQRKNGWNYSGINNYGLKLIEI